MRKPSHLRHPQLHRSGHLLPLDGGAGAEGEEPRLAFSNIVALEPRIFGACLHAVKDLFLQSLWHLPPTWRRHDLEEGWQICVKKSMRSSEDDYIFACIPEDEEAVAVLICCLRWNKPSANPFNDS